MKHVNTVFILLASLLLSPLTAYSQPASTPTPNAPTSSWFKASEIAESTWRIDDQGSNIYLLIGKHRALLIDTGYGVANLRDYVKKFTSLPLMVVNTHGHPDHIGADNQFPEIYVHPDDVELLRSFSTPEARKRMAAAVHLKPENLAESERAPSSSDEIKSAIKPIADGYIFDLGERHIEVITTPGHTPGEIVLLDREQKLLFTGDNNNYLAWLHLNHSLALSVYLKSLEKLAARSGEFATVMPAHGPLIRGDIIGEQIACVKGILDGSLERKPYESFAGNGMIARYKRAVIAFNPNNL